MSLIEIGNEIAVCCPECMHTLDWHRFGGRCLNCGRAVVILNNRLFDFEGTESPNLAIVMSWSDDFFDRARSWLPALRAGSPLPVEIHTELEAAGLATCDSRLTPLGVKVDYQLLEQEWQTTGDQLQSLLAGRAALGPESRVLDVGCGAGQTLRLLSRRPSLRVGLDYDLDVLALGCRLSGSEHGDINFVRASGDRMPFRDHQFTHVICRVALNYMHQESVLYQMARVLQPGGILCCRIEGIGYDLRLLSATRNIRHFLGRLRDLGFGVVHEFLGVQPVPGGRASGGRAFATVRRIAKILRRAQCDVFHAEPIESGPKLLGLPTQAVILAARRS